MKTSELEKRHLGVCWGLFALVTWDVTFAGENICISSIFCPALYLYIKFFKKRSKILKNAFFLMKNQNFQKTKLTFNIQYGHG